jgi:hypothetical protein
MARRKTVNAAASGLNSGAGGQAQLAMSTQLQSSLSALDKAQANAIAALDLELTNLTVQYRYDLAEAFAEGNLSKVSALYENYQTERDSLIQQEQFYASLNASTDDAAYNQALEAAAYTGIFDGMAAFGWSQEMIDAAEQNWLKNYG